MLLVPRPVLLVRSFDRIWRVGAAAFSFFDTVSGSQQ